MKKIRPTNIEETIEKLELALFNQILPKPKVSIQFDT